MEVKVGKYTFVITENIESWNGITTNITPTEKKNVKISAGKDFCR